MSRAGKKQLSMYINRDLHAEMKKYATDHDMSLKELIVKSYEAYRLDESDNTTTVTIDGVRLRIQLESTLTKIEDSSMIQTSSESTRKKTTSLAKQKGNQSLRSETSQSQKSMQQQNERDSSSSADNNDGENSAAILESELENFLEDMG